MGSVEEVRIARRTGFCYGVREAIDYARLAAAEGKLTHTLGQVVHNEGVIAQLEERARRRARERGVEADQQAMAAIEAELRRRDGIDSTRQTAPLRIPDGALVIQTEGNTLEQTVADVVAAIRRAVEPGT